MNAVLATIPSPDRGVWHLGPVPIRAYALCIILGIIVAISWGERRWVARGGQKGDVTDIAVFAVPFGLVGGRLYHVITDNQKYFGPGKNPLDAFAIWNGGLGIWGAIALGGVGAWIACRRKGIPLPAMADALAPGIVVAQAIGRLGNYFNQELYGGDTTLPWGLEIYQRVDPATGLPDMLGGVAVDSTPIAVVHPTFLYELLWNLGVAALVVWADRKFRLGHGRAFALYVAGYCAGRFWIELMRTDEATLIAGVRVNVFVSALVLIGAVAYFVLAARKGEREDVAALQATPEAPAEAGAESSDDTEDATKTEDTAEDTPEDTDEAEEADEKAEAESRPQEPAKPE
ncbi:prolipoprotein diacylglyceryl transferase [Lentzea tibetensis]|uniref:Phosphatidylglycerol--prolipoprotein diacylglyceryl transferase n=1 Tax=Lentzea tibetensis TaxID=2591470 RepID=A0A563ERU2_9PSEU|nr:prolipoprotein diacylglyceryl transferase [Lentzea tibetensis]TWP50379.1 prolipoprotein diacylglyceryl transferase [Lentzea tibetensis]